MKYLLVVLAITLACAVAVGGYSELEPQEVASSSTLRDMLDFGKKEFIRKAYQANDISNPELTLEKVSSVHKQVVAGLNLKFDLVFTDSEGKVLFVTLVVYNQPWTGFRELTSYNINDTPQF